MGVCVDVELGRASCFALPRALAYEGASYRRTGLTDWLTVEILFCRTRSSGEGLLKASRPSLMYVPTEAVRFLSVLFDCEVDARTCAKPEGRVRLRDSAPSSFSGRRRVKSELWGRSSVCLSGRPAVSVLSPSAFTVVAVVTGCLARSWSLESLLRFAEDDVCGVTVLAWKDPSEGSEGTVSARCCCSCCCCCLAAANLCNADCGAPSSDAAPPVFAACALAANLLSPPTDLSLVPSSCLDDEASFASEDSDDGDDEAKSPPLEWRTSLDFAARDDRPGFDTVGEVWPVVVAVAPGKASLTGFTSIDMPCVWAARPSSVVAASDRRRAVDFVFV